MSGIASGAAWRAARLSGAPGSPGGKVERQVLILAGVESSGSERAGHGDTSAQLSATTGRKARANIRPRSGSARCRGRSWELLEEDHRPAMPPSDCRWPVLSTANPPTDEC